MLVDGYSVDCGSLALPVRLLGVSVVNLFPERCLMKKVLISVLSIVLISLISGCPQNEKDNVSENGGVEPAQPDAMEIVENVDVTEADIDAAGTDTDTMEMDDVVAAGTDVVVTVNGKEIVLDEVNAMTAGAISNMVRGGNVPPEQLMVMQQQMRPRIVEALIDRTLLGEAAANEGVEATDADLLAASEKQVQTILKKTGMTREELDARMRQSGAPGLEAELAKMRSDESYAFMVTQDNFMILKFSDQLGVSDEEVGQFYESNKTRFFVKPEEVRASHILAMTIVQATREPKSEAEQEAARVKIEGLLAAAQDPCSDFAALAREHSECSSAAKGGDLDFFAREGQMVEEFSAAAFAMKVGEVSDVVKSPSGYHIIKVTERRASSTTSLEEVSDDIRLQLEGDKKGKLMSEYVKELRKTAEIVYGENYQPAPAAGPMGMMGMPMPTAPATQPESETVEADTVE